MTASAEPIPLDATIRHTSTDLRAELARQYPTASAEEIGDAVDEALASLAGARIHHYVPLLAFRQARDRLRLSTGLPPVRLGVDPLPPPRPLIPELRHDRRLTPGHDPSPPPSPARRGWIAIGALAAVLAVGVTAIVLMTSRGAAPPVPGPAPTTAAPPTSAAPTSAAAATTTAPVPASATTAPTSKPPVVPADAVTAVWPTAAVSFRYADPVAAARGFAVGLAGFRTPVLGRFRAGDSRSGEVDVRSAATGPATIVFVRKLGDGTWWVLGSATADVHLDTPGAGDLLASPATMTGRALAFEGVVGVRIVDDAGTTLATGTVVGGGDMARPFNATFPLAAPRTAYGAVVLTTDSARDGRVWTASVLRVRLR